MKNKSKLLSMTCLAGALTLSCCLGNGQMAAASETNYNWLIYVYLCGSDLESQGGMATMDLMEMMAAELDDTAAFYVQTGGAAAWDNDVVSADASERYLVTENDIYMLEQLESENMGEASVLAEFIQSGQENISASHTGLIFWDHGSGSINGVCFDENYDYDSLSLDEISSSLAQVQPFDFIGFDACLMSTVETAVTLAPYADYMIASEETEPGYGWDYASLGAQLMAEDWEDVEALGKVICDGFYAACEEIDSESLATLSVTKLSEMENVVSALEDAAGEMKDSVENIVSYGEISKGIAKAENYGGNNNSEGYTNMVDLGDMMNQIADTVPGAEEVLAALEEAVVYQVNGQGRSMATGLSIYYPLSVQGSQELQVFEASNPSGNYVEFVKSVVYGAATGDLETSGGDHIWSMSMDTLDEAVQEESYTSSISFAEEPYINEDDYYTFTLSEDSLDYVQSVQLSLFQQFEEEEPLYYLGNDNNVIMDWDTGSVTDNFGGTWPALPDGQELMFYILNETDDYTLYSAPILLNGEEMSLRFMWVWDDPQAEDSDGRFMIVGVWEGIDDETGAAGREPISVSEGDTIVPLYYGLEAEEDDLEDYTGAEYVVEDGWGIEDRQLPEGTYLYAFEIVDIFGQSTDTEFVAFYVDENGDVEMLG